MESNSKGLSIASLVLGIISVVFIFTGGLAFIGLITAIVGLVLGSKAKTIDPTDGMAKAGFILSLIALIVCAIVFIVAIACVGSLIALGGLAGL